MADINKIKQQIMRTRGLHWDIGNLGELAGVCLSGANGGFCEAQLVPTLVLPDNLKPAAADRFWAWLRQNSPEAYAILYQKAVNEDLFIGYPSMHVKGEAILSILGDVLAFDSLHIIEEYHFYPILASRANVPLRYQPKGFWTNEESGLHEMAAKQTIDLFLEYARSNPDLLKIMQDSLGHMDEQMGLFKGFASLMGEGDFFDQDF